jgi:hypothetical protein
MTWHRYSLARRAAIPAGVVFIALERGYFTGEALDVEPIFFDAASDEVAANPKDPKEKAIALVEASDFCVNAQARLDVADVVKQVACYKAANLVEASVDATSMIDLTFVKGRFNAG